MKNFVAALMIAVICMTVGIANAFSGASTHCLRVEIDQNFEITGNCWEKNGKYYDATFEFVPGGQTQSGGLYWKLKTITEATNCECDRAPVAQTGQEHSYATGGDGNLTMGVPWPRPRFADHKDGTVTDNLTGLIWLKNAGCFTPELWDKAMLLFRKMTAGFVKAMQPRILL